MNEAIQPNKIRAQSKLNPNPVKIGLGLGVAGCNSGWAQPEPKFFFFFVFVSFFVGRPSSQLNQPELHPYFVDEHWASSAQLGVVLLTNSWL